MTRLNLLDALTNFTNEVMREILLPVRRQKGDEEEPVERPPFVYRQRLPDVKSATSKAPYILHQRTIRKVRCGCLQQSNIFVRNL